MFFLRTSLAQVGTESEYTIRAVLVQEEALHALQLTTNQLLYCKLLIVHCTTGYHRAETVGGVVAATLGWHGRVHVLHLSCCRTLCSDLVHEATTALRFCQDPWPMNAEHGSSFHRPMVDHIMRSCYSRPESCATWELFEESKLQLVFFFWTTI